MIQRVLMLMLWMCCLSFAQEEKNELGLLLGVEFIPQTTTTLNQKLSFGKRHRVFRRLCAPYLHWEQPFAPGAPVRCRAESQSGERTTQHHYQPGNVIRDAFVCAPSL